MCGARRVHIRAEARSHDVALEMATYDLRLTALANSGSEKENKRRVDGSGIGVIDVLQTPLTRSSSITIHPNPGISML